MANIDDVFAAIPDAQAITVDDSVDFVIDSNLRVISIPIRGVVLGVEGDKDVNRVTFLMPKMYKGVDLSTFQIRVNYANANGEKSFFKVTETSVVNDQIRFIWVVSADAVAYMGNVEFVVRFVKLNGSTVVQELNTTLANAKSLIGLSVDSEITPVQREDLLAHFYSEIDTYSEQKKNEILGSIPSDYTQLSNDVDSLKQDVDAIPKKQGYISSYVTDSTIKIDNEIYDVTTIIDGLLKNGCKKIIVDVDCYVQKPIIPNNGLEIVGNGKSVIYFESGDGFNFSEGSDNTSVHNLIIKGYNIQDDINVKDNWLINISSDLHLSLIHI